MLPNTRPTITTLVIGADYTEALSFCLESKTEYAKKHGYNFVHGGDSFWDRNKPIAWSKIPFLLNVCASLPEGALIWQSDADVLITNPELTIEEQMVPLLPDDKDMLLSLDACGHINSGNILFRNTAWARDFWKRVGEMRQFTYHLWWENAAMIALYAENKEDHDKIHITREHKKFNAYLRGIGGEGIEDVEALWEPDDFLVHFAGVYDLAHMSSLAQACKAAKSVEEAPRLPMPPQEVAACMAAREQSFAMMNKTF